MTAVPFIKFPPNCEVCVSGALRDGDPARARFQIRKVGREDFISVYFDDCDALGSMGQPYWELYPNQHGNTERFLMGEEVKLSKRLRKLLNSKGLVFLT